MSSEDQWNDAVMLAHEGPSQLCSFCAYLFSGKLSYPADGFYNMIGRTTEDLKPGQFVKEFIKSVDNGCHLCWLFWIYLSESTRKAVAEAEWIEYNVIRPDFRDGSSVQIEALQQIWKSSEAGLTLGSSDLMLMAPDKAIQLDDRITKPLFYSSDSERTFEIAKRWLKDCSENHEVCKAHALQDSFLPTRLLDLGSSTTISLCLSENLERNTEYMTLSHCWGSAVPLTLTSATFSHFLVDIPYAELPKTFQEAVQITRMLGIRYLWIDSLCIIQGSSEDWKKEAAVMGEVYRHSWCNIAATKAKDGRGGCFDRRFPLLVTPCRIDVGGEPTRRFYCVPQGIWISQIDSCPLSSRGWVFQEIMLSPRVLHYGKGQVFWECCELRACESHPGGSEVTLCEGTKIDLDAHTIQEEHKLQFRQTPKEHDRYYIWDKAVQEYSKRALTFPQKDIFYAISGIARLAIPPEEYLAGLWNSPMTLIEQLLWHTDLASAAVRSAVYRAPSWSWASLDSNGINFIGYESIQQDLNHTHDLVEILEAHASLEDEADAYGPVIGGLIRLRGTVITSTITGLRGASGTNLCFFGTIRMSLNHDFGELYEGCTVHCLPMRLDTDEEQYQIGSEDQIHGLILEPTGVQEEYFRRGYFMAENTESLESPIDANVLKFWNLLLHGPGHEVDDESGDLVVEDLKVRWENITIV